MPAASVRPHLDFDTLMRDLAVVGAAALVAWAAASLFGLLTGYLVVAMGDGIRFVLAALLLVSARSVYRALLEWRWRRLSADQRLGFAGTVVLPEADDEPVAAGGTATGSPQP